MLTCLKAEKKDFTKETFVLRTGDTADAIGLVLSGTVLIMQEDIWGNRNILSKAGPGQAFAAAYACAPGSRLNVSVMAETPVTAMFINVKRILDVCPSACSQDSVLHGQKSCPSFPQKRSGGEPANLRFRFQDSSLRIILALSAAGCHRSLEG